MSDFSIIEFAVYGFIAYSSVLMLLISAIKDIPDGRDLATPRMVYMAFGVIFAFVLMSAGGTISLQTTSSYETTVSNATSEVFTAAKTETNNITLMNPPVWILAHFLIATMLIIYIIIQALTILAKG